MAQVREFSSAVSSENPLAGTQVVLDGVTFECKGRLSVLDMSELAAKAISDDTADAAEAASIYQTLSLAFGPEEYPRLKAHIRQHNTPDEVVLQILQAVNEAMQEGIERITGRPTGPSSSSPDGPERKDEPPVRSISLSKGAASKTGRTQAKQRTPRRGETAAAGRRTG